MRSPGSMSWAWRRRRSLRPISSKPCSRVASKFSGEPVRIQVLGASPDTRRLYAGARRSQDGYVLHLDLAAAAFALDAGDQPVDDRAQQQQQLADHLGELLAQLVGQHRAQR